MQDQVRAFLSSGAGRRALMSAGAYIAGAYLGYVMPGGLEAIHEAFQYAVTMNPFWDPAAQITALFEGAQYQAASALHSVGDWFQSVGVEIAQRFREEIEKARAFIGPGLDQAKTLFLETWQPASEAAVALRDQIRNALPTTKAVLTWAKGVGEAAIDLVRNAVEVYGIYEAAKKCYGALFSRAKEELRERVVRAEGEPETVTERTINLNLNTAIGGGAVADAALRSREIRLSDRVDPTAGLSAMGRDQIIWVSDKLGRRVSNDLNGLLAQSGDGSDRITIRPPSPDRLEDPVDPVGDLRHRARFPIINWEESALSADRLSRMRCGTRIGSELQVRDDLRDLKLILADDGTLQVKREQPSAPRPDLMM